MRLLFHCCCAPCSVSTAASLRSEGFQPHFFWYNPNIHLFAEYQSRRNSLSMFAANENYELKMIDEYGLEAFLNAVLPGKENRCEKCYRMRLEKTASIAAQDGFNAFTTSLLISPYQDHETIKRIGEEAAAKYGIEFFYRDFRPLFRESQNAARTMGLYMQKYCGCIFSEGITQRHKDTKKEEDSARRHGDTEEDKEKKTLCSIPYPGVSTSASSLPPSLSPPCLRASVRYKFEKTPFQRLALITGEERLEKLKHTKVIVVGAGGVGSWAAEALVRSGIGKISIIDSDTVCPSNINRQIEATTLTVGLPKASALKKRLLEINPDCEITAWDELFCRENAALFDIKNADYVIDAIDSLNHKLDLIEIVCNSEVKLFSSMGMARKIDPSRIKVASIWDTGGCPLARLVRQGLRARGFSSDFTVVYSTERLPRAIAPVEGEKPVNGSIVTVTASAGFFLASLVLRDITGL